MALLTKLEGETIPEVIPSDIISWYEIKADKSVPSLPCYWFTDRITNKRFMVFAACLDHQSFVELRAHHQRGYECTC